MCKVDGVMFIYLHYCILLAVVGAKCSLPSSLLHTFPTPPQVRQPIGGAGGTYLHRDTA